MDFFWSFQDTTEQFGDRPVSLQSSYRDLLRRELKNEQLLNIDNSVGPIDLGRDVLVDIHRAIKKLANEVSKLK